MMKALEGHLGEAASGNFVFKFLLFYATFQPKVAKMGQLYGGKFYS
jgi:hypothetical protein